MQTTWGDEEREDVNDSGGISFPKTSTNPNPSPKALISLLPTLNKSPCSLLPTTFLIFWLFTCFVLVPFPSFLQLILFAPNPSITSTVGDSLEDLPLLFSTWYSERWVMKEGDKEINAVRKLLWFLQIFWKEKVHSQLGASSGMIEDWFHNVPNLLFSFQQLRVLILSMRAPFWFWALPQTKSFKSMLWSLAATCVLHFWLCFPVLGYA